MTSFYYRYSWLNSDFPSYCLCGKVAEARMIIHVMENERDHIHSVTSFRCWKCHVESKIFFIGDSFELNHVGLELVFNGTFRWYKFTNVECRTPPPKTMNFSLLRPN